ncbi:hypothetical protein JW992_11010 [candidate division KSB1 bacterium]|nr:hypothetical protein [candidate division KSB1 bacterium]
MEPEATKSPSRKKSKESSRKNSSPAGYCFAPAKKHEFTKTPFNHNQQKISKTERKAEPEANKRKVLSAKCES